MELLEYVIIAYGASVFFFQRVLLGSYNKTAITCLVIGILNVVLPMSDINERLFGKIEKKNYKETFDEIEQSRGFFTVRLGVLFGDILGL